MDMTVVCSPASAAEAERYVTALRAAGLHPMSAYQGAEEGLFEDKASTYPILAPKAELIAARAIIRAMDGGVPQKDQYEAPVGTLEQSKRAFAALGFMALVIVVVAAVLMGVQYLGGMLGHHG